jgi:hypothetical protein
MKRFSRFLTNVLQAVENHPTHGARYYHQNQIKYQYFFNNFTKPRGVILRHVDG